VNLLVGKTESSYPSLRENLDTEILIVGGGITGSLIASMYGGWLQNHID
jgi:hypothetical protein